MCSRTLLTLRMVRVLVANSPPAFFYFFICPHCVGVYGYIGRQTEARKAFICLCSVYVGFPYVSLTLYDESRKQVAVIDTAVFSSSTIKVTTKLPSGQVVIFSSTHHTKRVVTTLAPEKSPESLAVELLREGELCSL